MKIEAIPVKVPREVYDRVKHYSTVTGVPVAKVIREALSDWLESVGDVRMEVLSAGSQQLANIVCINEAQPSSLPPMLQMGAGTEN